MILTNEEYNLLNEITSQTKTDCWFCLQTDTHGFDYVLDLESGYKMNMKLAVEQLNEAIIPNLLNITDTDVLVYTNLLDKLGIVDNPFQIMTEVYNGNTNGICTKEEI